VPGPALIEAARLAGLETTLFDAPHATQVAA